MDEITHCYGPEPMLIEDRGMVESEWIDKDGKRHVARFRIGVLRPLPSDPRPRSFTDERREA